MTGKSAGKKPKEKNWQKYCEKLRPLSEINYQWNLGIATGPASKLLVLDVDDIEKFKKLSKEKGLKVPRTFTVRTGSGGLHYYYRYPADGQRYGNRSYRINKDGVFDMRGIGGQVVAPGSIHLKTGNQYTIENDINRAEAPQWLLDYSLTGNLGGKVKQPAPVAKAAQTTATMFDWNNNIEDLPINSKPKT
jgi:hypothetical protein